MRTKMRPLQPRLRTRTRPLRPRLRTRTSLRSWRPESARPRRSRGGCTRSAMLWIGCARRLRPQPSTLNPQPSTLHPQPSTLTLSLSHSLTLSISFTHSLTHSLTLHFLVGSESARRDCRERGRAARAGRGARARRGPAQVCHCPDPGTEVCNSWSLSQPHRANPTFLASRASSGSVRRQ